MARDNRLSLAEWANFIVTNGIPRYLSTRLMGWYSDLPSKTLTKLSIAVWRWFASDLDLSDSEQQQFDSLQACFTRKLRLGSRVIDRDDSVIASPVDAIIGAHGRVADGMAFQLKGMPYTLNELLPGTNFPQKYRDAYFITLRLKSSFYHRFHAPISGTTEKLYYFSGDTWNVNPPALKVVDKLFCRNERAALEISNSDVTCCLVPVAAILVASMQFNGLDTVIDGRYRGPRKLDYRQCVERGDELGFFRHGSTIVMFVPPEFSLAPQWQQGDKVSMGMALLTKTKLERE